MSAGSAPTTCPICSGPIAPRPRGSRHGHPPKTCSDACRKERKRRIERERYYKVKDSDGWMQVRSDYLKILQARRESDPEFDAAFRARAQRLTRESIERLKIKKPDWHEKTKARKRAQYRAWRATLIKDPAALEAHKAKQRAWYAALTPEERERIYYEPRRKRLSLR